MPHIVINYRREDTSPWAGRLYDRLVGEFGGEQVFMDIDTLDYGVDYVEAINRAVRDSQVLVAVIGPRWTTIADQKGNRRLDNPLDFVRLEIKEALSQNIRVIPILVGGAVMPSEKELPDDISAFARRNALEISDLRFQTDIERLIQSIRRLLNEEDAKRERAVEAEKRMAEEEAARQRGMEEAKRLRAAEEEEKRRDEELGARLRAAEEEAIRKAKEELRNVEPAPTVLRAAQVQSPNLGAQATGRAHTVAPPSVEKRIPPSGQPGTRSLLQVVMGAGKVGSINWVQCAILIAATWLPWWTVAAFKGASLTPDWFLLGLVTSSAFVICGAFSLSFIQSQARAIVVAGVLSSAIRMGFLYYTSPYFQSVPFTVLFKQAVAMALWPVTLFGTLLKLAPRFRNAGFGILVAVLVYEAVDWIATGFLFSDYSIKSIISEIPYVTFASAGLWFSYKYSRRR